MLHILAAYDTAALVPSGRPRTFSRRIRAYRQPIKPCSCLHVAT